MRSRRATPKTLGEGGKGRDSLRHGARVRSRRDTLKTLGENWKYAVDDIKFIPMTYPQNRKPDYGIAFTKAGYERVIRDLEELGGKFENEYAVSVLGNAASQEWQEGDLVVVTLRFQTREYNSQVFQDITVNDIYPLNK